MKKGIYQLKGKIQHYAWGGKDFMPQMLGIPKEDKPYAEYWMGAHDKLPSDVVLGDGKTKPLNHLIEEEPELFLGEEVEEEFGKLPFLFKLQDVKDMLSIQVHPTKEEAMVGFEREDDMGISINATDRNYKDENHKPEVLIALSEFWLLHGFKGQKEILSWLDTYPALVSLKKEMETGGYKQLYNVVMTMPQKEVDALLAPILEGMLAAYRNNSLPKNDPAFWAARAIETFSDGKTEKIDRGIFSIFFFNLVKLNKGEGIFQGAGLPHAYLEGQCMELMSNSDNVIRGGLTPKHIDVTELMRLIKFDVTKPDILKGEMQDGERIYHCPVPDFVISSVELKAGEVFSSHAVSLEILFCTQGELKEPDLGATLSAGNAYIITAATDYDLEAVTDAMVYKAAVPL